MTDPAKSRHPHVVNLDDVEAQQMGVGGFLHRSRRLGPPTGAQALGCSHIEVPPGKTGYPFHFHSAFEEALFILEGEGTLRIGKDSVGVHGGDYIALPAGPETAHALTNTGTTPLRYLAMSSPAQPATMDIVVYPDSKKISFAAGVQPDKTAWRDSAWVFKLIKDDQPKVEYYEDEPLARK